MKVAVVEEYRAEISDAEVPEYRVDKLVTIVPEYRAEYNVKNLNCEGIECFKSRCIRCIGSCYLQMSLCAILWSFSYNRVTIKKTEVSDNEKDS